MSRVLLTSITSAAPLQHMSSYIQVRNEVLQRDKYFTSSSPTILGEKMKPLSFFTSVSAVTCANPSVEWEEKNWSNGAKMYNYWNLSRPKTTRSYVLHPYSCGQVIPVQIVSSNKDRQVIYILLSGRGNNLCSLCLKAKKIFSSIYLQYWWVWFFFFRI